MCHPELGADLHRRGGGLASATITSSRRGPCPPSTRSSSMSPGLSVVLMTQVMPATTLPIRNKLHQLVHQAILDGRSPARGHRAWR